MDRAFFQLTLWSLTTLVGASLVSAQGGPKPVSSIQPPTITLRAATTQKLGESPFVYLTLRITNPNKSSLTYTGYAPNSFDPPLPEGRLVPFLQIKLQREGKWKPHPLGRCLFGVTDLELAPEHSSTFKVALPQKAEWDSIKVIIGQFPGFSEREITTTTTWSREFTREEVEQLLRFE